MLERDQHPDQRAECLLSPQSSSMSPSTSKFLVWTSEQQRQMRQAAAMPSKLKISFVRNFRRNPGTIIRILLVLSRIEPTRRLLGDFPWARGSEAQRAKMPCVNGWVQTQKVEIGEFICGTGIGCLPVNKTTSQNLWPRFHSN